MPGTPVMERKQRVLLSCVVLGLGGGVAVGIAAGQGGGAPANDRGRDGMLRSGTAFFVTHSGEMLTSAHVVRGCRRIEVWVGDGKRLPASLVATDDHRDVALLATQHAAVAAVRPVARSARQGAPVYTIGFGLTPSSPLVPVMTRGQFRGNAQPKGQRLFVLRAALHEGNSGGPVVDAKGGLLGMVVGRYAKKPDLGVAVPAADLAQFLVAHSTAGEPAMHTAEMEPDAALRQVSALVQCVE
jgi:S1-C subfamily serine protease